MMSSSDIEYTWKRIRDWYESHVPESVKPDLQWRPGASLEEINATEQEIGLTFPDSLRESYLIHNGDPQWIRTHPTGHLLSLDEIIKNWKMREKFVEEGYVIDSDFVNCDPRIRRVGWDLKWIPITDNGSGNPICVDLHPTKKGAVGQVFDFINYRGPVSILGVSFGDFLTKLADDLEAGRYIWDNEAGQVVKVQNNEPEGDRTYIADSDEFDQDDDDGDDDCEDDDCEDYDELEDTDASIDDGPKPEYQKQEFIYYLYGNCLGSYWQPVFGDAKPEAEVVELFAAPTWICPVDHIMLLCKIVDGESSITMWHADTPEEVVEAVRLYDTARQFAGDEGDEDDKDSGE